MLDAQAEALARRLSPILVHFTHGITLRERVTACLDGGGTTLDLRGLPIWELSTSLVDLPSLAEIQLDEKTTHQGGARCMFEEDEALARGTVQALFEELRTVQRTRREGYASLGAAEEAALTDALASSCKPAERDRVTSAVAAILAGETTVLVLTAALETSVPAALERLGRLVDLRVLDLLGNNLERVPDHIGEMRSLEVLGFCGNRLTELPESIGRLSKLKRLVLSANRLTRLPESFVNLTALEHRLAEGRPRNLDVRRVLV